MLMFSGTSKTRQLYFRANSRVVRPPGDKQGMELKFCIKVQKLVSIQYTQTIMLCNH